MCRKLICLIIFALVLALSGAARAELLANPGFEASLEGWKNWGGGSGSGAGGWFYNSDTHATVMEDGTANGGDKYVEIGIADMEGSWWAVMLVFQEFPVTEGKAYEMSGWFRDGNADGAPSLVEGGGMIQWEWRDAAPVGASNTDDRGELLEGGRVTHSFDLTDEWTYQSDVQIAPPGAKGLTAIFGSTSGGINVDVDDCSFGPVQVTVPVPDAGFEDHVLSNPGDWIYIGDAGYTGAWKNLFAEEGAWLAYNYYDGALPALSGNNKVYATYPAATEDYIYQILDETYVEGMTYTLSVWAGNAWEGYDDSWSLYFTGDDYTDELASIAGNGPVGEWGQVSLVYTATAADAGKKIGIKMKGAEYVTFDDVTLSRDASVTAQAPVPADDALRVSPEPLLNIYDSDDVPLNIPDRWMTTTKVYSSLDIPELFTITDLNVQLDIKQPGNNADLNVFLIGPDGTRVELFTDVGVTSLDDFKNTILDDEASISVRDGRGRFEGTFRPEGKLSAFDGKNAHGTWKLEISDDFAGNVGTLNSWRLIIESPNILSWTPADLAASQDVYISKNLDDVKDSAEAAFHGNFASHVSTIEIILEVGQQYFWRVDSLDADGALIGTGDVWSFWTTPEPIFVNPDSDLAAATESAKPGGIVEFAAGTYNITSQIIVKEGVTYVGAGPDLTIIDGGGATRAFAAWGDRGATDGQVDAGGNGIPNLTGPTRWVIEGMTIQNCASDEVNRQDILSSARDLLNNYTGTPYTLATASEENGGIADNPEAFAVLSGGEDDELTDAELQAYLDAVTIGSEGHLVVNDDKRDDGGAICILNGADGTIRNCAFSNNTAIDDGGAIMVDGQELDVTIENCAFNLNTCGDQAGAVKLSGAASNSTVIGCTFTDNSAPEDDAGAIQMDGAGSTGSIYTLTDCTFTNCSAFDDGGAILATADNSTYVWTDCAFVGNYVTDSGADGGAVRYNPDRADMTVKNCLFIGNGMDPNGVAVGDDGGAWKTDDDDCGPVTFMNCLFADNASKDDRILEVKGGSAILNCTFIGNVAGDEALIAVRGQDWNSTGATDDNGDDIDDVTTDDSIIANCLFINNTLLSNKEIIGDTRNDVFAPTVINCLFFGNLDQNEETAKNTDDNSVEVGTIDVSGVTDAAQIVVDPAGDYNIAEDSPAIDASDPDTATAADIVGMPAFGIRDVGAYESEFVPPPTIAWVSFHGADDEPSSGAAGAGFTEAADKPYTDLLKANGYKVKRYITTNDPDPVVLNAADLVIISRSVSSGGYQNDGATRWNNISAPMIVLGGYVLRNSRMGYTTGGDMPDTAGDIKLAVTDPNHPIFAGIALTDGVMDNPFAGVVSYADGTLARGISVNNNTADDEGTVLATVATVDDPTFGGMVIGEWPAGATLEHSGGAGTDVLAGPRLVFLTGSREADGISSETAGLYDLYEDGEQMFLNAVEYMLP